MPSTWTVHRLAVGKEFSPPTQVNANIGSARRLGQARASRREQEEDDWRAIRFA
jgi:hypothetical protein